MALSDEEIDRIAEAIVSRQKAVFAIDEEKHYNSHKRLDHLLDAYDNAANIVSKTLLGLVVVGALFLAGLATIKGVR